MLTSIDLIRLAADRPQLPALARDSNLHKQNGNADVPYLVCFFS
jgi:hypothetical protein